MAFAFVQGSAGGATTGTTPSRTLGAAPTQGNLLVAFVSINSATITLDAANSYSKVREQTNGDRMSIFWKVAGAGEPTSQQPAVLGSSVGWNCTVLEYSGASDWALDIDNAQNDNVGVEKASPSVTPTAGIEVLLIGVGEEVANGDGPWNPTTATYPNFSGTLANERSDLAANGSAHSVCDLVVAPATGSYQARVEATVVDTGSGLIAIFKAADPFPAGYMPPREAPTTVRRM